MKTPGERLRFIRQHRGFKTAAEAARYFGWKENTYKSSENGIRNITAENAEMYGAGFRVRPGWLLFGEGTYNSAPAQYTIKSLASPQIPLLDWNIVRDPAMIQQGREKASAFAETARTEDISVLAFALINKDESMNDPSGRENKSFRQGEELVFDPEKPLQPGCFILAQVFGKNETVFRQYRESGFDSKGRQLITLHPLNPAWPDDVIIPGETGAIIGRLIRSSQRF